MMVLQGGMPEWLNGVVSNTTIPARVSEVQILLPPPTSEANGARRASQILLFGTLLKNVSEGYFEKFWRGTEVV